MPDDLQFQHGLSHAQPCDHETAQFTNTTLLKALNTPPTWAYRYEPLDREIKSIRLLQVMPGEPHDSIRCRVQHFDLASQPIYVALSYMWDHATDKVPILCNDLEIGVGQNLYSFLQQFRKTTAITGAWLWIDALCINQDDVGERNHQVAQMKDIYQGAALVIAWLGAATKDDILAFSVLRDDVLMPSHWPWEAWFQLFRKPYWRRIWIIQEFVLGEETHMWCGNLRANSDDFMSAGEGLDGVHNVRGTLGWRLLTLRRLGESRTHLEQLNLRKLSTSFANSNSTDTRDYVYGFLGLARDLHTTGYDIVPDYSKSAARVLIDVVRNQCKWTRPEKEQPPADRAPLSVSGASWRAEGRLSTLQSALDRFEPYVTPLARDINTHSQVADLYSKFFLGGYAVRDRPALSDDEDDIDESIIEDDSSETGWEDDEESRNNFYQIPSKKHACEDKVEYDENLRRVGEEKEALRREFRLRSLGDDIRPQHTLQGRRSSSKSRFQPDDYTLLYDNLRHDTQDEIVQDHDFISHLMRKMGVSRGEVAKLVLDEMPDLRPNIHIIVAKDWLELRRCRQGSDGAFEHMLVDIFGFEACQEMGIVSLEE
jgi:hypothetical protein